jgi:hypothetical protein
MSSRYRVCLNRSSASLDKLEQTLADLAALGPAMMQAIEAGNDVHLLAAVQVARGLRARLKSRDLAGASGAGLASREVVERLRQLVAGAQVTEKIADRWLSRALPGDRELLARPGGDLFLADAMLPGVWDFQRDRVVLVGSGTAALAAALRQLGQERILWYTDGAAPDEDMPEVLRIEQPHELGVAIRGFGVETPDRLAVRWLDPERAEQGAAVAEQVRTALSEARIHRNTIITFNRTWLDQGLINLRSLCACPSVSALDGQLAGKPLVIIAPGPSLAGNIHLLAELKGKAVLLAVSHALSALTRAGISPDFVLAVDPQDLRYHYAGSPLDRVAALINAVTVHPDLFALGAPHTLSLAANGALDDWLYDLVGDRGVVAGGGSVATTAFALAMRWRCDPIAVVGLDLSFPGGQYYIDTSCDGQTRAVVSDDGRSLQLEGWSDGFHAMKKDSTARLLADRMVELPGWHGEPVPTSFMFSVFHRWFEEGLRRAAGRAEVWNCTEGGAFIAGMNHAPLARFIERVAGAAVDPMAVVAAAVAGLPRAERERAAAERLARLRADLQRCRALARRCMRMATRHTLAGPGDTRLDRAERALVAALGSLKFLSMMAQAEIGGALLEARDVASVAEAVGRSAALFAEVYRAAAWLEPRVREAERVLRGG